MTRQTPLSKLAEGNVPGGGASCLAVLSGVIALIAVVGYFILLSAVPPQGYAEEERARQFGINVAYVAIPGGVLALLFGLSAYRSRTPFYNQNHLDYVGSKAIQAGLPAVVVEVPRSTLNIDTTQPEVYVFQGLQLGEVSRHFDSQTSASIEGYLNHNLQVSGRAVSYQRGLTGADYRYYDQMSAGNFSGSITGQSSVHLTFSGTTRDNLLADGFVAVLEQETAEGWMDTLRVIVPSEPAMREYVQQYIASMGKMFPPGSHRDAMLTQSASTLAGYLSTDVSYVSDRLNSILRMPSEKRPMVTVVGTAVTGHAIVGGAIQFGNDGNWYQLFPIGLVQKMTALMETSASKAALPS